MQVEQGIWSNAAGWTGWSAEEPRQEFQIVVVTGHSGYRRQMPEHLKTVKGRYPNAAIIGCSTAGEILGDVSYDGTIVCTAISFRSARVKPVKTLVTDPADSLKAGAQIARQLDSQDLRHVLVFSDGLNINGSELVRGMRGMLPSNVMISGGLAGDGADFKQTYTVFDLECSDHYVVAAGIYGDVKIGCGSVGGWEPFGPYRMVSRSEGSILYELDNRPALGLYKQYLGPHAEDLPASGLLFPLCVCMKIGDDFLVRTLLGVDESNGAMTFAGDIPEGAYVRLMKTSKDKLILGAEQAALVSDSTMNGLDKGVALLISCVGRKLVLKQRTDEELEAVAAVFGGSTRLCGFYSYGEISPRDNNSAAELHNQTMTVTLLAE